MPSEYSVGDKVYIYCWDADGIYECAGTISNKSYSTVGNCYLYVVVITNHKGIRMSTATANNLLPITATEEERFFAAQDAINEFSRS